MTQELAYEHGTDHLILSSAVWTCNAPSVFQALMNDAFLEFLDDFVAVYLDDIMIYSKSEEEHLQNVETVSRNSRTTTCTESFRSIISMRLKCNSWVMW
jgi:hypothetical protein